MKKILFLMMGGSGTRLGSALPKQFLPVGGSAIYQFILDLYARAVQDEIISIDRVVLVHRAVSRHTAVRSGRRSPHHKARQPRRRLKSVRLFRRS